MDRSSCFCDCFGTNTLGLFSGFLRMVIVGELSTLVVVPRRFQSLLTLDTLLFTEEEKGAKEEFVSFEAGIESIESEEKELEVGIEVLTYEEEVMGAGGRAEWCTCLFLQREEEKEEKEEEPFSGVFTEGCYQNPRERSLLGQLWPFA